MVKEIIEVEVRVEREIAYKEDSNWANYACVPRHYEDYERVHFNAYGNMACTGIVHKLDIGSYYKLKAEVVSDPRWGIQYKIIKMSQDVPSTPEEQKEYIRMLVTKLQFDSIYSVYEGQDIVQLMKDDTFDYKAVHGFGQITYNILRDKVLSNLEMLELLNEFPMLNYRILRRLMDKYPTTQILSDKLRENPYVLTDFAGVGWKTADSIAMELGIENDSEIRIHAGIRYMLREAEQSGDTYVSESKMISGAYELLKVRKTIINDNLKDIEGVVNIDGRYGLLQTFKLEYEIAERLKEIHANSTELNFDVEAFIARMEDKYKIKLSEQQKSFFHNIKKSNVNFLIGYAGCGKSMLQKLLIDLAEQQLNMTCMLAAPTGKAAKVLSRYTRRQAYTIHKAAGIGIKTDSDSEEGANLILEDFIIIDESSMCGVRLMKLFLEKLGNPKVRVLFVGDDFQLPSVDCGSFLRDCVDSGKFPVTKLDIVFRQGEGGILDVVTKVRNGEKFVSDNFVGVKEFGDNCLLVCCPQDKMEAGYLYYYKKLIDQYGIDGVLTLSPTKKGKLGTFAINRILQEIVNPEMEIAEQLKQIKEGNEVLFRIDDRIMNTKNTYKIKDMFDNEVDIMNGDTGIITEIDIAGRSLTMDFDDKIVKFAGENLEKILHALCITMHKSQGSSAKAVLSITDKAHTHQLNANIIYTAWSRPEEFLIALCQPKTLNAAIREKENLRRNTFLKELLLDEIDLSFIRESVTIE